MKSLELDIKSVGSRFIDKQIMTAEGFWISAKVDGDRIIAGGKSEYSGSKKDHQEPAGEGEEVDALPGEVFGVVGLLEEGVCFMVAYFHYYYNQFIGW